MDKNLIAKQKEIDNLISKRSNLTAIVVVIVGGNLSLLIMLDSIIKIILFIIGILSINLFTNGLLNNSNRELIFNCHCEEKLKLRRGNLFDILSVWLDCRGLKPSQ